MSSEYDECSISMALFVDYSKGFGGKYGVQKDRVDQVKSNFIIDLIC